MILCYDVTNRASFDDLDKWLERCRMHAIPGTPMMVVGCKCEDDSKRRVRRDEAEAWARANGNMPYVETSAKNNINVHEAFRVAAEMIIDRMNAGVPMQPGQQPGGGAGGNNNASTNSIKLGGPTNRGGPGERRGGSSGGGGDSGCPC